MLWQVILAGLITITLGLSSLLLQVNTAQRRISLTELAAHDHMVIARGASAYLADETGQILEEIQSFIYKKNTVREDVLRLGERVEAYKSRMLEYRYSRLGEFIHYYLSRSTFIRKLEEQGTKHFRKNIDLDFDFTLGRSEFYEIRDQSSDPQYKSTLISADRLKYFDREIFYASDFYQQFSYDWDYLKITKELLRLLVRNNSDYAEILENQEEYGIYVHHDGLAIEQFPNAVTLEAQYPVFDFTDKENRKFRHINMIGTAQIDIVSVHDIPEMSFPEIDTSPAPTPSEPQKKEDSYEPPATISTQFDIGIRALPSNTHGIYSEEGVAISEDNPLRIVSSKSGGLSTLFINEEGHIEMSIGRVFDGDTRIIRPQNHLELNDIHIQTQDIFDETIGPESLLRGKLADIEFHQDEDDKEWTKTSTPQQFENADILESKPDLILDMLPRQYNRYGTVKESFNVNGIFIPEDAVIVATQSEFSPKRLNKSADFQNFAVYDSEGALITRFHRNAISNKKKLNQNIDLTSFNTEKGFVDKDGSKIFQTFSTKDLFEEKESQEAIKSFLSLQADLASSLQLNINQKKKPWHKDIYKNLKKSGISYISDTLEVKDPEKAAEIYIAEKRYIDEQAKTLDKAQFTALINMDTARKKVDEAKDALIREREILQNLGFKKIDIQEALKKEKQAIKQAQKEKKQEEKSFKQVRKSYDNYIKTRKIPANKVTKTKSKPKKAVAKKSKASKKKRRK